MADTDQHILFGIDGGGSGCRVAAVRGEGTPVGEVTGGPANVTSDRRTALSNILQAITQFASSYGISDAEIRSSFAHIGTAGVITQADKDEVAAAMPFDHVTVSDDCETSLIGALQSRSGVLAAIGTGTIIAARTAASVRRFGGWGLQISDQASGAWLGRRAHERSVLAQDGLVAHSELTRSILSLYNNDLTEMVAFARAAAPKDYAKHALAVIDGAKAGDENALYIMRDGAAYLMNCLRAAKMQDEDVLCLTAGVGPHYAAYLDAPFQSRIAPALGTSLDGALILAKRLRDGAAR